MSSNLTSSKHLLFLGLIVGFFVVGCGTSRPQPQFLKLRQENAEKDTVRYTEQSEQSAAELKKLSAEASGVLKEAKASLASLQSAEAATSMKAKRYGVKLKSKR
jgi:hypothetical protein